MAELTAAKISQNSSSQSSKAGQLNSLATSIASKIEEIDTEIKNLVKGGIEGTAVQDAADSYLKSRKAISQYVQRFAATAVLLDSSAEAMAEVNRKASTAANGGK